MEQRTPMTRAMRGVISRLEQGTVLLTLRLTGTWILIAITVGFFVAELALGGTTDMEALIRLGALRSDLIFEQGEWYRLICPIFLHAGIIHLVLNGLALLPLLALTEQLFGTLRAVLFYLLCGIAASLTSATLTSTGAAGSVGASGAIMGLVGLLLGLSLWGEQTYREILRRVLLKRLVLSVAAVFALGIALWLVIPIIDNWAHAGGLGAGLVISAFARDPGRPAPWPVAMACGAVVALSAFAVGAMFSDGWQAAERAYADAADHAWHRALVEGDSPAGATALAQMIQSCHAADIAERCALQLNDQLRAIETADTVQTLVSLLFMISKADAELEAAAQRWVEIEPREPTALNALAWHLLMRPDESLRDLERATRLAELSWSLLPEDASGMHRAGIADTVAWARYQNGDVAGAVSLQREAVAIARDDRWASLAHRLPWPSGWESLDSLSGMEDRLAQMEASTRH